MATVLLVEDDADVREDLAFLIEMRGYRALAAANGAEALEALRRSERPRLILLDLMMPVMDGWAFRAEMLRDPRLADIPVVLLSGAVDVRDEAASLQAAGVLTKPIDLDRLFAFLEAPG